MLRFKAAWPAARKENKKKRQCWVFIKVLMHRGYTVKVFNVSRWQQLCKWKDLKLAKRLDGSCINALYKCVDRQRTLSLVAASPVPLSTITLFHFLHASLSACLPLCHRSIISPPILPFRSPSSTRLAHSSPHLSVVFFLSASTGEPTTHFTGSLS